MLVLTSLWKINRIDPMITSSIISNLGTKLFAELFMQKFLATISGQKNQFKSSGIFFFENLAII